MTRLFIYRGIVYPRVICLRTALLMAPWCIAITSFFAHPSLANNLPEPDNYVINYAHDQPVIDGLLDDSIWSLAKPTSSFVIHDSGVAAPVKTVAQLAYDQQYLYLAATCEDADIYAHYTENQSHLFRSDDLVEIFIDPDGDGKHYLEIGFSAKAVHYSLMVPEVRDGKVEPEFIDIPDLSYRTQINGSINKAIDQDKFWTLEARIPLNLLRGLIKKKRSPSTWRIGLFRIDYSSPDSPHKASGFYAWQHLGQFGFHKPERFAYITFEKSTKRLPAH